jgi:hypothetical protein
MSSKVTDLPAGVAAGGVFYVVDGSTDSQVTGGAANGVATLDAAGKLPVAQSQTGAMSFGGDWNASTNTPTLANGVGTAGVTHIVSVAGSQNLGAGVVAYAVGDMLVYDGALWDHYPGSSIAVPTGANPTATVGLAAVNGAATTFMRSDAAPAIDQAIAPTWTGQHIYNALVTFARPAIPTSPSVMVMSATPEFEIAVPGAPLNQKRWNWSSGGTGATLTLRTMSDTGDASSDILTVTRAANAITGITSNSGSGQWSHTGSISATGSVAGNTTVTAGIGSNSVQMSGAPNGSDPSIKALGVTDANVSIEFQAKGSGVLKLASPTAVTGTFSTSGNATFSASATFGGNVAVAGTLGSAANTSLPGPTNSGITFGGAPTWAMQSFYDQALTANNRTADLLFITNQIKFRFVNDARNAFLDVLSITGGQAMGVTGITSTSGSGTWAHTGAFSTTKAISAVTGADGNKLWLAKYSGGTGHTDAPKTLGAASTYIQVGGREYGSLGFAGIGFGYVGDPTQHPAVWVGHEEIDSPGNTAGDFVVATRPTTTNVAPTERFRVTKTGAVALGGAANTGTSGQVLTSAGAGAVPTWQTPAASGGGALGVEAHSGTNDVTLSINSAQVQLIDASTGSVETVVNLPDALDSTPIGKVFTIKKTDASANGVSIDAGEANIDGSPSQGLSARWSVITVVFDGTNYQIMNRMGS